jgi:EAL domain-containing protein (putative c-di-GMP-specific phosphodiesterase class I)/ActR/RegA family two-component response regulator
LASHPSSLPVPEHPGSVVLVDDDPLVLRGMVHMLKGLRQVVVPCGSAREAIEQVSVGHVRAIVSDISMPELTGIDLLRTIRELDPDLPVILVTGQPELSTAAAAIEYGALKYLVKPVNPTVFFETVEHATRLYQLAQAKRQALTLFGEQTLESERAGLETNFERALSKLWLAYQPIVRASDHTVFGYEALLRSDEPTMMAPGSMLEAAERLGTLHRLGRNIRAKAALSMTTAERPSALFVNLHPEDLLDPELLSATAPLSAIAGRVVLEVTERAMITDIERTKASIAQLRAKGFRIAVDDLGAGYAGLSSFALLEPEFVKLDMSLMRNLHSSKLKRKIVHSITSLCRDMGLFVVAEGIETVDERDAAIDLGCDLLQGNLFARPAPTFQGISPW